MGRRKKLQWKRIHPPKHTHGQNRGSRENLRTGAKSPKDAFFVCGGRNSKRKLGTCKVIPPGLESGAGDRKLGTTSKKIEPTTLTKPETNAMKSWRANLENIQKPEKGQNGGMLNEWGRNYRNSCADPWYWYVNPGWGENKGPQKKGTGFLSKGEVETRAAKRWELIMEVNFTMIVIGF